MAHQHFNLLPLTFFVMLISHRPLGVIFPVNANVPRDYEFCTVT
jgi:hypothetical protein